MIPLLCESNHLRKKFIIVSSTERHILLNITILFCINLLNVFWQTETVAETDTNQRRIMYQYILNMIIGFVTVWLSRGHKLVSEVEIKTILLSNSTLNG